MALMSKADELAKRKIAEMEEPGEGWARIAHGGPNRDRRPEKGSEGLHGRGRFFQSCDVQDCADLAHSFHPTPLITVHQLNTASGWMSKELCGVNGLRAKTFVATMPAQRVEIVRIFNDTRRALVRFPSQAQEERWEGKMARLKMLKGKASGCQGRAAPELDQGGHWRGARQLLRAPFIQCNLCHLVPFFFSLSRGASLERCWRR
eukprot:g13024.t1